MQVHKEEKSLPTTGDRHIVNYQIIIRIINWQCRHQVCNNGNSEHRVQTNR